MAYLRTENAPWRSLFKQKRRETERRSGDVFLVLRRLLGAEQLANFLQERFRLRVRLLAGQGGELLEQLALLAGELLRDLDGDPHVLVTALVAVEMRNALAPQPEYLSAL